MQLAEGIAVLEISAEIMGRPESVHPVLLWDAQSALLVDTGYPKQLDRLTRETVRCGVPLSRVNRVMLTHQDIDHIGCLPDIANESSEGMEVYAHALEKPYIEGKKRLLRFTDEAIAGIDLLPSTVPETFKNGLKAMMLRPPGSPVDSTVTDGDRFPWYGGLTVIGTPGHTPGHISLYHEPSRTLIAGDALTARDGVLFGPDEATALDLKTAVASLRRLQDFPIEAVVCYHGGVCLGNINARLAELIAELSA